MQYEIVCGIDPGLVHTGYAVIQKNTGHAHSATALAEPLCSGVLTPDRADTVIDRLLFLAAGINEIANGCGVTHICMESVFINPNRTNAAANLKLAMTRGALMVSCMGGNHNHGGHNKQFDDAPISEAQEAITEQHASQEDAPVRKAQAPRSFTELAPTSVKQAITGKGRATKIQVAAALPFHLPGIDVVGLRADETDALAIALAYILLTGGQRR